MRVVGRPRFVRRLVQGGLLAVLGLLLHAFPAEAHALLKSSDPSDGESLPQTPAAVTLTFTEPPDARLSTVHLLDASGRGVGDGPAQPVAGQPLQLRLRLPRLPDGVYTVTWQTVSAADGHVAGGAFAFGVGVTPAAVAAAPRPAVAPPTPPPSPLGVASRWVLYVGLGLLVGGSWIFLLAWRTETAGLLTAASGGAVAALLGVIGIGESQREGAGVDWATFDATALGHSLQAQAAPVLAVMLLLAVAWVVRGRARGVTLCAVIVLAAVALFTHVLASHAPSGRLPWLMVAAQWAHLAAFSVWIGGLAALLLALRGAPSEERTTMVRRFSRLAGGMLGLVAVTGLLRAVDEVGAWSSLVTTLFGGLVLVKVLLLLPLAALGAVNRYRNVPAVAGSPAALRRVAGGELTLAAGVLLAAALLTSLPPPIFVSPRAPAQAPSQAVATGSDYGTTVKARLAVSPGHPGPNDFSLRLVDYDSGKPVHATVSLRFSMPSRPDVGDSSLDLTQKPDGTYRGASSNLSLAGRWQVTVEVGEGVNSVEIPLTVDVKLGRTS